MPRIIRLLSALLLFIFWPPNIVVANSTLQLTDDEQAWIAAHPKITVANETDWPPFDFMESGKPAGYSIDMLELIAAKTGLEIEFINGYTWDELLQQFISGKIDVLPAVYYFKEREKYTLYTASYYAQPSIIAVHEDNAEITGFDDLAGKRMAAVKGFGFTETLQSLLPDADFLIVDNILDGLKTVSAGEADAFVESIGTVAYTLEKNFIPNIKIISNIGRIELNNPALRMGVNPKKPLLRNIIDKALAAISLKEKRALQNKWLAPPGANTEAAAAAPFVLTRDEEAWLLEHPSITIGMMDAWPPMDYVDSDGEPRGVGVELIRALNKRLNNQLKPVPGPWDAVYRATKQKRLDALLDITPTEKRQALFHFTTPYIEVPHNIFTQADEPPVNTLSGLDGKVIGVEKDFFILAEIKNNHPGITVMEYANTSDALDALSKGETYAYVGNRAVANYIIENELITNIKVQGKITETSSINAIGVRKDWPILRDILQKALDNITPTERSRIVNPNPEPTRINGVIEDIYEQLTPREREWLQTPRSIRLGLDPGWPPVEWINDRGDYLGMTSDYIRSIANILNLNIIKPEKMSWDEVLDKARHKEVDLIPAIVPTPERAEFLNFSDSYLEFPFVIFTRDDATYVNDFRDLHGKRVGIERSYSSREDLARDYPDLELVDYDTTVDILHALSVGKIDAYVGNLTVAVYLLNREGLTNIKVSAPTSYHFNLTIGVRKDWPELQSIINKAIARIDDNQRDKIHQRWLKLNYEVGIDTNLAFRSAVTATAVLLAILLWLVFVQRQKNMLKASKAETEKANTAYLKANSELILANSKLQEMDRMKSMFIASISHELRTPLNSIIGFSSIMKQGSFGELNEKYLDYITRINKSGQHLLSLITDIIDISKIEAGRIDVVVENFQLTEMLNEAVSTLQEQLQKKGLQFILDNPLDITLHTDRRRLYQCLLNLFSNAIKYTEHGSIVLTIKRQGNELFFEVSDTGIGINEEDQGRLFQAFERMDSHLRVKAGGTGLGLYLTRKIVTEILQGTIGAISSIGEGSTFWIRIPIHITPKSHQIDVHNQSDE